MKSVVSYPEWGTGGKNSYRGNCSPKLIEDLVKQFKVTEISDYMVGGGTTKDVAERMGIKYHVYDLSMGFNLVEDEIQERNEFIFNHPPYWDIIKYSGNMWGDGPTKGDLSQIEDYYVFIKEYNKCIMKQYYSLDKGGHLAILMGDIKRKGVLYSMLLDICKPGIVVQKVVKMQYNCMSDSKTYANYNFIPIVHEDLLILKKPFGYLMDFKWTKTEEVDIRDSKQISWKDLVATVLEKLGNKASLKEIYDEVDGHKKCQTNNNWEAKIRQTLQLNSIFKNVEKGVWALAA